MRNSTSSMANMAVVAEAMGVCDPHSGMHHLFHQSISHHLFADEPGCKFGETFDEKSEFDNTSGYEFTAKVDGYYHVNARELGYPESLVGNGSKLGKFVARHHSPKGKAQHGKYMVNVYPRSEILDTVHAFFR